mgnify:CR=1 FL=1
MGSYGPKTRLVVWGRLFAATSLGQGAAVCSSSSSSANKQRAHANLAGLSSFSQFSVCNLALPPPAGPESMAVGFGAPPAQGRNQRALSGAAINYLIN